MCKTSCCCYYCLFSQVVFIGPFEHHSNILPWRETGIKVRSVNVAACREYGYVSFKGERKVAISFQKSKLFFKLSWGGGNSTNPPAKVCILKNVLTLPNSNSIWNAVSGHVSTSSYELLSAPRVNKLQLQLQLEGYRISDEVNLF